MEEKSVQPSYRSSRVRRWVGYLWREAIRESRRPVAPAFAKPNPAEWSDDRVTVAWLGHATVLINFFGIKILTDPVLFPRIGIRIPFLFTIGPKRLTAPALSVSELPKIDLILLSHAHFDHFDTRTLRRLSRRRSKPARRGERRPEADVNASTKIITAPRTSDLLRWTKFRDVTELRWGEQKSITTSAGEIDIIAFRVKHWGARMQHDDYRGYNGYLLERNGRRIIFSGDTAMTDSLAELRKYGPIAGPDSTGQLLQESKLSTARRQTEEARRGEPVESTGCPSGTKWVDLAIMSIGCYNPWIRTHCNPEQAIQMANDAGAQFIMPVHHQTFRLSFEPFREPIERFEAALRDQHGRIALREIGETFVLPL
jgi:L-ascorbate metabolism protein UlaG (beta-lactamase superfamily)